MGRMGALPLLVIFSLVLASFVRCACSEETCSRRDIVIAQSQVQGLRGMPKFTVEITNQCAKGCAIRNIHVSCGWFSSTRLVNPKIFRRVSYNDCLVNDGQPLKAGQVLSFQYATSFMQPLRVSSLTCVP